MERPPRNIKQDKLVTTQLMFWAYLQIGMLQLLAGLFAYAYVFEKKGITQEYLWSTTLDQNRFAPIDSVADDLYYYMCCYPNQGSCSFFPSTGCDAGYDEELVSLLDVPSTVESRASLWASMTDIV